MAVKKAKVPAARMKRRAGGTAGAAGVEAARRKFEAGVVARNEAVPAGTPLPPGATHEIVGTRPDGTPILKRKRFSAA